MREGKQSIDLVFTGMGLSGNIYIGNYSAASNPQLLKSLIIKSIITVGRGLFLDHDQQAVPNYLYLPADDTLDQDITQYFNTVFDFIQKHKKKTNILVHCFSGISRSTAIVLSYLAKKYNYHPKESLLLLRTKRSKINPNKHFIQQLEAFHDILQQNKVTKQKEVKYHMERLNLKMNLSNLKNSCDQIQDRIQQAKLKIMDGHNRKRSTSQFLKKRLSLKHENSLKKDNPKFQQLNLKAFGKAGSESYNFE